MLPAPSPGGRGSSNPCGSRVLLDGQLLHHPADLRLGRGHHHGPGWCRRLRAAAGRAVPGHHAAPGRCQRGLRRRQRADRRRHRNHRAGAADQRRRGHVLHVIGQRQRRHVHDNRHLQGRLRRRYCRGGRAEPCVAGHWRPAGHREPGRHHDPEEAAAVHPDGQPYLARRLRRCRRPQQLRLPAARGPHQAPARRGRRDHLRREALLNAGLAQPGPPGPARRHGVRRGGGDPGAEPAGRGRSARPGALARQPGVPTADQRARPAVGREGVRGHRRAVGQ